MRERFGTIRAKAAGLVLAAGILALPAAARAGAPAAEEEFSDSFTIDTQEVADVIIVEDNWLGLRYRLRDIPNPMLAAAHRLRSVRYGKAPDDLISGLDALESGQYAKARAFLSRLPAIKDKKIQQYVHMGLLRSGRALGNAGAVRGAAGTLVRMSDDPKFKSRFLPEALLALGDADRMEGKYASAGSLYAKARTKIDALRGALPGDAAYGGDRPLSRHLEHLILTARLRGGECTIRQAEALRGKDAAKAKELFGEAELEYRGVQTAAIHRFDDVYAGARLGVGRCLIAKKDFDDARKHVESLIGDCRAKDGRVKNRALLGPAYALLGDVHYAAKDFWRARFEYLRVTVLYPEDREALAYCYYRAGLCCQELEISGQDKRAGKDARGYWTVAARDFKGTRWAREAEKKLAP